MKGSKFQRAICFAIAIGGSIFPLCSLPESAFALPGNHFQQVEPGFWRGALPRKDGLEQLKTMGIRTVIDLMDEDPTRWNQIATNLGMRYVNIPLRRTRPIPPESIKQFLAIVQDPANRPVYVHCRAGRDRTGAMIAIYRIQTSNWSSAQAIQEMKSLGFNPMFKSLSRSVVDFERDRKNPGSLPDDTALTDGSYK